MRIDIASLSLDIENFRHKKVKTERDAIQLLLMDEKKHKVSELAQDIVEQGGLDPSSLLIVAVDPATPGQFIALEGNRRVTALKALMTPDLAKESPSYTLFRRLHPKFLALNISTVECVVLDRIAAAEWIKRKHYIGMGGKGVIGWDAVATARSNAADGRFTRWLAALSFLDEHGVDSDPILNRISSKTTTIERVLVSPHIVTILGLVFGKDGTLTPENGDKSAAVKLVNMLLEAMADPKFTEPQVSTATQQQAFIERFSWHSVRKKPPEEVAGQIRGIDKSSNETATRPPKSFDDSGVNAGGSASSSSSSESGLFQSRSKPVRDRKYLAEPGLKISNSSLNRFYGELKKLSVEKNPFVSAAIIRIFLEKATTVFLEEMNVPTLNKSPGSTWHDYGIKLKSKVDAVLKQIDPDGKKPKLAAARDVANGNQDRLHSLDELNRAIHDHTAMPAPSEILTMWSRFHPYFIELFEVLESQRK
ncbi:hypothetical protein AB4Y85_01280 [Microvirga sp. 2YAF29]|uniref:hypothetical protein n=1 Tax=Microvirga sp. 2YAF29 TaxID=3233031 RepID=UPI003F9979D7